MTTTTDFERLWSLGYRTLLPIIPPGSPIDPNSSLANRVAKAKKPLLGKIPGVRKPNGLWTSISDWHRLVATEDDLKTWGAMGAGVGIRIPDDLVLIDADTLSLQHAATIRDAVLAMAPTIGIRVGNFPKCGYLASLSAPMPYARIDFGGDASAGVAPERIELLTAPRQFVALGMHPCGKPYEWHRGGIPRRADLPTLHPDQLLALLDHCASILPGASRPHVESASSGAPVDPAVLRGDPEMVRAAIEALPNDDNFPSYDSYIKVGYALKGALPDNERLAEELFVDWASRWTGDVADPGIAAADFSRCKPPYRIGAGWLYDVSDRLSNGRFSKAPLYLTPEPDEPANPFEAVSDRMHSQAVSEAAGRALKPSRVDLDELENIPPRQWLYGTKISRKYVSFVASPGGVGKTAWVFAMALAAATGRKVLHDQPHKPLNVWIYNLEDDRTELMRRLKAAVVHHKIDPAALSRVHIDSGRDRPFKIVRMDASGSFLTLPDYAAVKDQMRSHCIDLLIIDPFLRSHGVPENANEAQDEVMRLYAQIAEETNAGVLLVHHTKKGAIAGDMDSLRGGSTQGGGARAAFTLSPMGTDEAAKLGIPEHHRRLYVRVDDAKNNMAPPVASAEWLRLASVRLNNADAAYPSGDSVQVAEAWSPPAADEGMGEEDEAAALASLEAGLPDGERYSMRSQDGARWAGALLRDYYFRTPEQARVLLSAWEKSGRIKIREYKSSVQRKMKKGIFVVSRDEMSGNSGAEGAETSAGVEGA